MLSAALVASTACQAAVFAAMGAIFAAIELAALQLVSSGDRCCTAVQCGAINAAMHQRLCSKMALWHRRMRVREFKSFQPSRDPILPETGLGQRAGRFPGVLFGCTMKSKS